MNIQESKERIHSLYDEIKKEVDEKVTPTGVIIQPSASSFCSKVDELIEEVKKYSELDESFYIAPVLHTLSKEVSYVANYSGNRKSPKKQREELESLMHKAIRQLNLVIFTIIKE